MKDLLRWALGNDTGLSSKAIVLALLGESSTDYPRDGADWGRCVRLVRACPEAREGVRLLAAYHPVWRELDTHWDVLACDFPPRSLLQQLIARGEAQLPRRNTLVIRGGQTHV